MVGMASHAEKKLCVVIHDAQGQTAFDLTQKPVVSFTETDVKMVCGETELLYPLASHLKMTIEEVDLPTAVDDAMSDSFTITASELVARGCESLSLYTLDGKTLATAKADAEGVAVISISQLGRGVYIVQTDRKVFKITKK